MKKKSYMNRQNILSEGIIDQIISWFKSGKTEKAVKAAEKKHPGLRKNVDAINKLNRRNEQLFKDQFGVDIKLSTYKLSDWIK